MARIECVDIANQVYHVLNSANVRVWVFDTKEDYIQFENILKEALERFICACLVIVLCQIIGI